MKNNPKTEQIAPKKYRFLRRLGRTLLALFLILFLLLLFIRSQWGQNIIVDKVTHYVSDKTQTTVSIDRLFISFDGAIVIEELFLNEPSGDTLVYSKYLEFDMPLIPILRNKGIGLDNLKSEGLRATIKRQDTVNGFNFQFLLDAFASETPPAKVADTTNSPINLILGAIAVKDARVVYDDAVTGIDSKFQIGNLDLSMEKTDLNTMEFFAYEGSVENTKIEYTQNPTPTDPTAEPVPLPWLSIEMLTLKNISGFYDLVEAGTLVNFRIPLLETQIPKADLANNDIDIRSFSLEHGILDIKRKSSSFLENDTTAVSASSQSEGDEFWPNYKIQIEEVRIDQTVINYSVDDAQPIRGLFNPEALFLRKVNLEADTIFLRDTSAGFTIKALSGQEMSGLQLHNMAGTLKIDDRNLDVESLALALNKNELSGDLSLRYKTLNDFIAYPEKTTINAQIPTIRLDLTDAYRFDTSLRKNEYVSLLSKKLINGNLKAKGSLAELTLLDIGLNWSSTRISGKGVITNVSNPDLRSMNLTSFSVISQRSDLLKFVKEEELSVKLPEKLALNGSLRGNMKGITTDAQLKSSQGLAYLQGTIQMENAIKFDAKLKLLNYDLATLLQNEQLGNLSVSMNTKGTGTSINELDAAIEMVVDSFSFNDYKINDLSLAGAFKNGKGSLASNYKDTNVNLTLESKIQLDSIAPEIKANLNIIGVDFQALGITKQDVRAGVEIDAFFKGNATTYEANAQFNDGVIVSNNDTYLLGSLEMKASVEPDSTMVSLQNKMIDVQVQSNADPARFASALQDHVYSYFYRDVTVPDTLVNPVNLKMRGKIAQTQLLNEVFLVNVKDLDTIKLFVDFEQDKRKLDVSVFAPHINYSDNELDSLAFTMNTSAKRFDFDLGFKAITAGPISIGQTKIEGHQENNTLSLGFLAYDDEEKLIQIKGNITGNRNRLRFHVDEKELILNRKPWEGQASNEAILTEDALTFSDFRFKRNAQEIIFTSSLPNINNEHIGMEFVNFKLQEFLAYLNPNKKLATGKLSGDFAIVEPFGEPGLLADLTIEELGFLQEDMGKLSLRAKALGGNQYGFKMDISEGAVDLDLTGDFEAKETGALLSMDLNIDRFDMSSLSGFTQGQVENGSGYFSGSFDISGSVNEPLYEGQVRFNNAGFKIAQLNAGFVLPDETIKIDNKGLSMNALLLKDQNGNKLIASGSIGTASFLNPTFDLTLNAENFLALNAEKEDNDYLYGVALIDAQVRVTGDLDIPSIDLKGTVRPETDITYIMPADTANIESREGIVIFVNRENPDAILTRSEEESATITGFNIKSLVKVAEGAQVEIIIDPSTGDYVTVTGKGDFNFSMLPNGRMTLTGAYEMSDGKYSMNLYNLVNRTFTIAPSSRISWSGDPFNAALDITAIYSLETSASALMAPISSGTDPSVQGRFREVLPFYVYLNVEGELLAPELSFGLDMPEASQGAIGGQVYGRVQQVNTQVGELNKQVFSLLVLNRFYPDPGSDGSNGGFANIARDNLNDALSDQLNVFSDKLLGKTGVEVNFGLDSYTDYQGSTPQERTQLDIAAQKKLFDDRLIVTVGSAVDVQGSNPSGQNAPIVGNVSLEYIVTEDGRYRLKGFRRSEFENVIDGQTIVSGIGLIFTQEFNQFSELWDAILRSKTKQLKEEEAQQQIINKRLKDRESPQEQQKEPSLKAVNETEDHE